MAKVRSGRYFEIVKPFVVHSDFLGEESLIGIAQNDRAQFEALLNESARTLRDRYSAYRRDSERGSAKRNASLQDFGNSLLRYLRYDGFRTEEVLLEDGQIHVQIRASQNHSVCCIALFHDSMKEVEATDTFPMDLIADPSYHQQKILAEVSELVIQNKGFANVVIFTPTRLFWFRADSTISVACLECNFEDVFAPDEELRIGYLKHLLGAESFEEMVTDSGTDSDDCGEDGASEEANEGETDGDEDDDAGSITVGAGTTRVTRADKLIVDDLEAKRRVTEDLHRQVTFVLESLVNARLQADPSFMKLLSRKPLMAESESQVVFRDALFYVYRILFVLYAEAKGVLPIEIKQYGSFYSLQHLLEWCEEFPRQARLARLPEDGTYVWESLQTIFTLLRRGVDLPGDRSVSPFNGQLFAPEQSPLFDNGPALTDAIMAPLLLTLSTRGQGAERERLNYANLGTDQLGAVYEALLAQRPKLLTEPHVWVESHGGGVGLVPTAWVKGLGGDLTYKLVDNGRLPQGKFDRSRVDLEKFVSRERCGYHPEPGTFVICPIGGAKRQTASYFTPKKLAEYTTYRALKPLIENKTPEEILSLRILEPSVGCGSFLVASLKVLSQALVDATMRNKAGSRTPLASRLGSNPKMDDATLRRARRLIAEQCLFGVDTNPLSLELCRVILYLESLVEGEPLPFLHHRLKEGNALIGADLANRFPQTVAEGVELPWAFTPDADALKKVAGATEAMYADYAETAAAHGVATLSAAAAAEHRSKVEKELQQAKKTYGKTEYQRWTMAQQEAINTLLGQVRDLEHEFEQIQSNPHIVDLLDEKHKDFKAFIPEMDPVLVEAEEVEISEDLENARKKILLREYGKRTYHHMVLRRKAYRRLKAFAHLACAMRAWPLDLMDAYPTFKEFQQLTEALLQSHLTDQLTKTDLGRRGLKILKAVFTIANRLRFFHADLEFASIMHAGGFSASLGNPPWKLIQVKDKDVFPATDPAFLTCKPSEKKRRTTVIAEHTVQASHEWWRDNHGTKALSHWWGGSLLAHMRLSGKIDLCSAFLLRAEVLTKKAGALGFIVSHSSTFVTKNTKSLRERFFGEWGLQEGTVFENRAKIFDIATYITFATLVGRPGVRGKDSQRTNSVALVQGVTQLADLDSCGGMFDGAMPLHRPAEKVELTLGAIEKVFSPELYAIPYIKANREVMIAEELTKPREGLVRCGDVLTTCVGIDGTAGPKKGLSIYRENLEKHGFKPLSPEEAFNPKGEIVTMYKGGLFSHFDPLFLGHGHDQKFDDLDEKLRLWCERVEQYGVPEKWGEVQRRMMGRGVKLAWRRISQASNQRTLVPCLIPNNAFGNENTVFGVASDDHKTLKVAVILSSLLSDHLCRYRVTTAVDLSVVASLQLDLFPSIALHRAVEAAKQLFSVIPKALQSQNWRRLFNQKEPIATEISRIELQAEIDALIFIHYLRKSKKIELGEIHWMLSHRFTTMNKQDNSGYTNLVMHKLENLWPDQRSLIESATRLAS